jgi:hypothetical protein
MSNLSRTMGLMLVALLVAACSSTTMSGSWSDPALAKKVKTVYIIGISKDETRRRIFEDAFGRQLASQGIKTFSSYRDLPSNQDSDREAIIQRMTAEGCDSVLLTKLIDTRSETVTSPGRVSGYSSGGMGGRRGGGAYYGGMGGGGRYNNGWGGYYGSGRSVDVEYMPPTSTEFVIATIESVMYDLESEEMIWSGQLETVIEGNFEKMVQDFVNTVSEDLTKKGII